MLVLRETAEEEAARRRLTAEWLEARLACTCKTFVRDRLYSGSWLCRRCQQLREDTPGPQTPGRGG
jgi:hypothetical protein